MFALFNRQTLMDMIDQTYANPLSVEPNWLCTLNLILAVGLQLLPRADPADAVKLEELGIGEPQCAESFYASAKYSRDLVSNVEDGDCSLVEALFLATLSVVRAEEELCAYLYR